MRQQLLVDLQPFTLQGIDCSFHIHSIPQGDRSRQQRQSAAGVETNCKADNMRGAYFLYELYFSVLTSSPP